MPNLSRNQPIARALYRVLITEHRHGGVEGLARRLGVPSSTLYAYAENTHQLPAWLLPPLWAATRDLGLLAELVGLDGVTLSEAPAPAEGSTDSALAAGLRLGGSAGAAQGELVAAIADGRIDEVEASAVEARITELEREAERLRAVVRSQVVRVVGVRR